MLKDYYSIELLTNDRKSIIMFNYEINHDLIGFISQPTVKQVSLGELQPMFTLMILLQVALSNS